MNHRVLWTLFFVLISGPLLGQDREAFTKSYQYESVQKYQDAIKVLLPLRPSYLVDLRLGWLYYLNGSFADSRARYQAAIKAAPKAVEPRLGYTLPVMAQGRYDELEAVTKTILSMDANNYLASLRLSFALRLQKKFVQAREVNSTMLELLPTDVSFLTEQMLVSVAMNNPDARSLCETILTLDPENVTAKGQMTVYTQPTRPPAR